MEGKGYKKLGGCDIEVPSAFGLIVFGASGDLTRRKIIPALCRLHSMGLLPEEFFVLGAARTGMTDDSFRLAMCEAAKERGAFEQVSWESLSGRLYYEPIEYSGTASFQRLGKRHDELREKHLTHGNKIMYMALPPALHEDVITNIGQSGLGAEETGGYSHIVVEKPFGRDAVSAGRLNSLLGRYFGERQIYRMDHYLAKENVQNILMFRFSNSIFEPLWDRRYIDHVQITVSETLGVEHRAGYYEKAGVLRDMFQNHLFQLLSLTAMEPPSAFSAERVRDEKAKVFQSVRPFKDETISGNIVLGQYGQGAISGKIVPAYNAEPGVSSDSRIPTFAAMRVFIDNWRWKGVPFYLRSGKRLSARKAEISIHFRDVPHLMFEGLISGPIEQNALILRVQPEEGVGLHFQTKTQGSKLCTSPVMMDYYYPRTGASIEAYERVLLDCMQGDRMLFIREDAADLAWKILMPALNASEDGRLQVETYESGSDGPLAAHMLMKRDGRTWRSL